MQVFNATFKIIRKNLPILSIYLVIFLFFAFMMTLLMPDTTADFSASKVSLVIVQEDGENPLSRDLAEYLAGMCAIQDIPDDEQSLQDALFFRKADCILRIPAGFGQSVLEGREDVKLIRTTRPDAQSAIQAELMISRYLDTVTLYVDMVPGLPVEQLLEQVKADLDVSAAVTLRPAHQSVYGSADRMAYYFKFLAYSLMAILVLGVTSIMLSFNKTDLRRRNSIAPVKLISFNMQLVLGNLLFAIATWLLLTGLSLFLGRDSLDTRSMLLLGLNALAFTLACLGIAFLIGTAIKSRNVQQPVANVLVLGTCFISGVYVPQALLGQTVLTIASFTPSYWYIHNIEQLSNGFDPQQYFFHILVQLGFAAAAVIVALVVAKQKRQTANA